MVLGVSPDDEKRHVKFIEKYKLPFTLLADTEHAVAEKYGAWGEKNNYGKKYMGIVRSTFLIGPDGKVAKVWPKVKAEGHGEVVLEALRAGAGLRVARADGGHRILRAQLGLHVAQTFGGGAGVRDGAGGGRWRRRRAEDEV